MRISGRCGVENVHPGFRMLRIRTPDLVFKNPGKPATLARPLENGVRPFWNVEGVFSLEPGTQVENRSFFDPDSDTDTDPDLHATRVMLER